MKTATATAETVQLKVSGTTHDRALKDLDFPVPTSRTKGFGSQFTYTLTLPQVRVALDAIAEQACSSAEDGSAASVSDSLHRDAGKAMVLLGE